MSKLNTYISNEILDHILGNGVFSPSANTYLGLSLTDPLENGSGVTEPIGGGYSRQLISRDAAGTRSITTDAEISFTEATDDWDSIKYFTINDALTGGNVWVRGSLTRNKIIKDGITFIVEVGDITLTFDSGAISNYLAPLILNFLFNGGTLTPPTHKYIGMASVNIVDANTGSTITELSGGAYARKICDSWETASGSETSNDSLISHTKATGDWAAITDGFLSDALTTGNILFYHTVKSQRTIQTDETAKWLANTFSIKLD